MIRVEETELEGIGTVRYTHPMKISAKGFTTTLSGDMLVAWKAQRGIHIFHEGGQATILLNPHMDWTIHYASEQLWLNRSDDKEPLTA